MNMKLFSKMQFSEKIALNFLSIFSDYFSPGEYYANPETILKIAFSLTSKVVLRHDYMSHDFTIYLYK